MRAANRSLPQARARAFHNGFVTAAVLGLSALVIASCVADGLPAVDFGDRHPPIMNPKVNASSGCVLPTDASAAEPVVAAASAAVPGTTERQVPIENEVFFPSTMAVKAIPVTTTNLPATPPAASATKWADTGDLKDTPRSSPPGPTLPPEDGTAADADDEAVPPPVATGDLDLSGAGAKFGGTNSSGPPRSVKPASGLYAWLKRALSKHDATAESNGATIDR